MFFSLLIFLAFVLLGLSDLIDLRNRHRGLLAPLLFFLGCLCIIGADFAQLFLGSQQGLLRIGVLSGLFFLAFLLLLLYTLFPASTSCRSLEAPEPGKLPLTDRGVYAFCRHPSMLWLVGCSITLYIICPTTQMGWLTALVCLLELIYTIWKDLWLCPRSTSYYKRYRREVPFLIPSPSSVARCLTTLSKSKPKPAGKK